MRAYSSSGLVNLFIPLAVVQEEYRQRVIQMGEHPDRVFLVGGLGVDAIKRTKLFSREELEASLDFKLGQRNLLITFHPVTLEHNTSAHQMGELLAALDELEDTHLIFTMPNADTDGRVMIRMVEEFCAMRTHAKAFTSLGQQRYFSCIQHCDGLVGNSSSGLAEVPSFNKGTVNVGDRQKGRLRAASVIDCFPSKLFILSSINELYSHSFRRNLSLPEPVTSIPGLDASGLVVRILTTKLLDNIPVAKVFHDGTSDQLDAGSAGSCIAIV